MGMSPLPTCLALLLVHLYDLNTLKNASNMKETAERKLGKCTRVGHVYCRRADSVGQDID